MIIETNLNIDEDGSWDFDEEPCMICGLAECEDEAECDRLSDDYTAHCESVEADEPPHLQGLAEMYGMSPEEVYMEQRVSRGNAMEIF